MSHQLPPKRILIIGPSNIGDAILAADVIASVRRRFPDAHLTLAVGERATALFTDDPRIQTLVDTDRFATPLGRLRLALALWRHRPQIVVDLRHTVYPVALKPLSAWRYLRLPPKRLLHMRERHLWKLRAQAPEAAVPREREGDTAGPAVDGSPLCVTDKDAAQVQGLWRRWEVDGTRPLVIICPGARSHIKRWTPDGFARVADRLISEARAQVVFSGEPDEGPVVEEILGLMRERAHSAVGLTTIRQLGALMARAQLVITNDSAALHLASACAAPTVAIFGPTDAATYGPTSPRHAVIRRRLFCAPCGQALCRYSHECMRFISAEEVFAAARELLEPLTV